MDSSYPKWKYHAKEQATIVQNAEEEKALGRGWHDEQVKDNDAVDPAAGMPEQPEAPSLTGDDVYDTWLADNGLGGESAAVKAKIRIAYDHTAVGGNGTTPQIEYGHVVGPQDSVTMVDDSAARAALLQQAKDMGVKVHHLASSKTIQAKIDEFNGIKASTPAAIPKDADLGADKE